MPSANPGQSFETASRHLFRHINSLDSLRSNPLAVSFFDAAEKNEDDRASLIDFHAKILSVARTITEESPERLKQRALRQLAIIIALCQGERSEDTANRLGLSERHYYRERHAICKRVSQALLDEVSGLKPRFQVNDAFRFLLSRAAALVDQGFAKKAASALDDAYHEVRGGIARSVVGSALARALVSLGSYDRASELLSEGRPITNELTETDESKWAHSHLNFTRALIAIETGDHPRAGRILEALARRRIAEGRPDEESVAAVVACGQWHCLNGAFSKARTMLQHARRLERGVRCAAPSLGVNIALLAASCADDPEADFGLEYKWLSEAKALSVASGSAEGALNAISGLLGYYASIGNSVAIYSLSEEALQLAQATEGTLLLQFTSTQIIQAMLRTPYWRAVAPLLFEIEDFVQPKSFRWAVLKHLQANFLRRTGRYSRAMGAFEEAHAFMRSAGTRALQAIIVRDLAMTQQESGAVSDAVESMRLALDLAEGCSNVLSLYITYEAAARLLKERRIERLAQEVRATLVRRSRQTDSLTGDSRTLSIPGARDHQRRLNRPLPRLMLRMDHETANGGGRHRNDWPPGKVAP